MLSKKTKYAMHALLHLARHKDEGPILISEISKQENIPRKFLESILLDLKKAGILASKKGRGGGYYLLKQPEDVHIAAVMRLFDGPIALLPCVTYMYYERCDECKNEEECGIRDVILELRNKTVKYLKGATLSEILSREARLQEGSDEINSEE